MAAIFARRLERANSPAIEPISQISSSSNPFPRNIRGAGAVLVERFGGKVPGTMPELLTLPGVARKTANVVLGDCFGKNEGIATDTHVQRLSNRLKLTTHKTNAGDKIEKDQAFLAQFEQSVPPLVAVKRASGAPGEIDAISGATISSRAIVRIINPALAQLRAPIEAQYLETSP